MTAKQIILRSLAAFAVIITASAVASYFILADTRPMLALLILFCGGALDVNLIVALYLINRNIKK